MSSPAEPRSGHLTVLFRGASYASGSPRARCSVLTGSRTLPARVEVAFSVGQVKPGRCLLLPGAGRSVNTRVSNTSPQLQALGLGGRSSYRSFNSLSY